MPKFIYVNSTETWAIVAHQEPDWQEIFGLDSMGYNIVKNGNDSGELENQPGWYIIEWKEKIDDCFKWLLSHKIISMDEYEYEMILRGCAP